MRNQPYMFELGVVHRAWIWAGLRVGDVVGGGWVVKSGMRSAMRSARMLATVLVTLSMCQS